MGERGHRVLVCDDEANIRDLLGHALEAMGFDVMTTRNGREALSYVDSWRPHLIILDYMLPGMNGKEVLSTIREHPVASETPVILQTGSAWPDEVKECLALGIADYLQKPYTLKAFRAAMEQIRLPDEPTPA